MTTKKPTPATIAGFQNIRDGFEPRPKTFAECKAEVDARLAAEIQRKTEQYEAERRSALGL